MSIKASTLRPGLLVSLKTSVTGNVAYQKQVLDPDHKAEDGTQQARWETTRIITDLVEHENAKKARGRARSLITSVCATSAFGLLCPETASDELDKAVAAARGIAEEFNATAMLSRVSVYVMTGRIAPDDVEAVKAINSEVRDLLDTMADGVRRLDVKTIRDAASQAKNLGAMLSPDAATRINMAIEAARSAAKRIVQLGEQAAQEIDQRSIRAIVEARTAFLDMDPAGEIAKPAEEVRQLDFGPDTNTPALLEVE